MSQKRKISNENLTLEELERETRRAERELKRMTGQPFVEKLVKDLEEQRRKRWKKCGIYTQEYVAEKAGISPSTYKGYVTGRSYHIDLITVKRLAEVLECKLSDVIEKAEH